MKRVLQLSSVLLLAAGAVQGQEGKLPVPEAAEQAKSRNLIRELFKPDYARRSTDGRKALGRRLLAQADESKEDPVARYVLLTEAVELSSSSGDAETLVAAARVLSETYAVDARSLKAEAFKNAKRSVRSVEDALALGQATLDLAEEAMEADDYDTALQAARDAGSLGRTARDPGISERASEITKAVPALKRAYTEVRKAEDTLKEDPENADANLTVGRYLCFTKEEWERGLTNLAKGSDGALKLIAGMELRKPESASDRMALGDRWSNLARGRNKDDRESCASRALRWYEAAMGTASSLEKLQLEKKIEEMARLLEGSSGGKRKSLDLLRRVDPRKHALAGTWTRIGNRLELAAGNGFSKLRFPIVPRGSYELEIHFTRKTGNWSIGPVLPVGDRSVGLALSWNDRGTHFSGLTLVKRQRVTANETRVDGALEDNRRYALVVRVMLLGRDQADIRVLLDGKPYVNWRGPIEDLSPDSAFSIADPVSLGWSSYQSELHFHAVRLRMLSGAAEPVR